MDIYEALNVVITDKPCELSPALFVDEIKGKLSDDNAVLWEVLKKLSLLDLEVEFKSVSFLPENILSNEEIELVKKVELDKVPLIFRSLIADFMWITNKEKQYAIIAANSYYGLVNKWINTEDWFFCYDAIKRCLDISYRIKNKTTFNALCEMIFSVVVKLNGQDKDFKSIRLIEILSYYDYGDSSSLIKCLDEVIIKNTAKPNMVKQAFVAKESFYKREKRTEDIRKCRIAYADYCVDLAQRIFKEQKQGAMRAEPFLVEAISIYRNNSEKKKAEEIQRKLITIQKDIPKNMASIKTEYDVSGCHKFIDDLFFELSSEEAIISITQFVKFYKKEELLNEINDNKKHTYLNLGKKSLINSEGQTVLNISSLPIGYLNPDDEKIIVHLYQILLENGKYIGDFFLGYAFSLIRKNYSITPESFDFLVKNNAIIPNGRERIIEDALSLAFNGKFYAGIHILAPQMEHIFRNIAKTAGAITVTLDNEGTSKEKVLSSIFDLPELNECYDNDILFLFRGLLSEQAGANIRNEIAHGLVEERTACSGIYLYFVVVVVKFLALTSAKTTDIYKKSKILKKKIEIPNGLIKRL